MKTKLSEIRKFYNSDWNLYGKRYYADKKIFLTEWINKSKGFRHLNRIFGNENDGIF
jgi:hypothetical protein